MSEVVIAPFSHNALRDWPAERYAEAIGLLLARLSPTDTISVIGTRGQRVPANMIVRRFPATRVINESGRLAWRSVIERIRRAGCVIGNNSGITHLSRHFGVPTVCVFGGSHQRTEWGPLGPSAVIVSRQIGCSPCQLNHVRECPYDKACLRDILPSTVADAAMRAIGRGQDEGVRT